MCLAVVRQRKSAPFNTDNMNKALRSGMYYLVTAMPSAWLAIFLLISQKLLYFKGTTNKSKTPIKSPSLV